MQRSDSYSLAALATLAFASSAAAQSTLRASVSSSGVPGAGDSFGVALSADGRFVGFSSSAADLVPGDTNGVVDVFVHDRVTGVTERISIATDGTQGTAQALNSTFSRDGRFVAFRTDSALAAGDTNGRSDVYVRDRVAGTTTLASRTSSGAVTNGDSYYPSLSADGRFLCFASNASDVVPNDVNFVDDVFVRDLASGAVTHVSAASGGGSTEAFAYHTDPMLSADGRFVTFSSASSQLAASDRNEARDVFVRDLATGALELVSANAFGGVAHGESELPSISADGRYVAFVSAASDLVPNDTNGATDVFLRDRVSGTIERISVSSSGAQADGDCWLYYAHGAISADGARVAFESYATNLVTGDGNWTRDAFVRDRASGTTSIASVSSLGGEGHQIAMRATLSEDGAVVGFESTNGSLVAGDPTGHSDVFVRDLGSTCAPVVSTCVAKTNSAGCAPAISASGEPRLSGPDAFHVAALQVLAGTRGTFVWSRTSTWLPFKGGVLCAAAPLVRTPMQLATSGHGGGACDGAFSFHFGQAYMTAHALAAGTTVIGQFVSRDPGLTSPDDVGITDAIAFTICP